MVSGRGWRRPAGAGCSRAAVPRAVSGYPPDFFLDGTHVLAARLETLKRRADFLRVAASGGKAVAPGLVLQAAPQPEDCMQASCIRVGFTASRRVGGAVVRNRAKRRLRAAAANVLPHYGRPQTDYVLIARAGTAERPFATLVGDLRSALRRIGTGSREKRAVAM